MKLINNKICRARYKTQTRIKRVLRKKAWNKSHNWAIGFIAAMIFLAVFAVIRLHAK